VGPYPRLVTERARNRSLDCAKAARCLAKRTRIKSCLRATVDPLPGISARRLPRHRVSPGKQTGPRQRRAIAKRKRKSVPNGGPGRRRCRARSRLRPERSDRRGFPRRRTANSEARRARPAGHEIHCEWFHTGARSFRERSERLQRLPRAIRSSSQRAPRPTEAPRTGFAATDLRARGCPPRRGPAAVPTDEGWTLGSTPRVVSQVVIHFDACGTSRRWCFEVLHDIRGPLLPFPARTATAPFATSRST
jgi:hypothetical protein